VKFVSLFAGIGGLDLGLERAGHECILQVEIDPFCQQVLAKHWPTVRRIADVRDVTAEDCEGADMLVGGFPCQPVSLAGKRLGTADERWLWPEYERLLGVVRPRYALVENVPGLFHGGFGDVLSGLASLGYDAEWSVVSACSVGAPQARERVFIVAYPAGGDGEARHRVDQGRGWRAQAPVGGLSGVRIPRGWGRAGAWNAGEPALGRVAHGIPAAVGQLHAYGNAVVPQVAEWIGRRLPA
jgi:DNA (cytosine-5)-methyltransferase 1